MGVLGLGLTVILYLLFSLLFYSSFYCLCNRLKVLTRRDPYMSICGLLLAICAARAPCGASPELQRK